MTLARTPPPVGGWSDIHAQRRAEREGLVTHAALEAEVRALVLAYRDRPDLLRWLNALAPRRLEEMMGEGER